LFDISLRDLEALLLGLRAIFGAAESRLERTALKELP